MDAIQKATKDMGILFNITDVLRQHPRYHQIDTIVALYGFLRDCLTYIRQTTTHTIGYVDVAVTNILSLDILLVEELRTMLSTLKCKYHQ